MIRDHTPRTTADLIIVAVVAVLAFVVLLALSRMADADPLPVRKVGSCPAGYASGVDWCSPMPGTTRDALQRLGQCPPGWISSRDYCLGPEKRLTTRHRLIQMLQDRGVAKGW